MRGAKATAAFCFPPNHEIAFTVLNWPRYKKSIGPYGISVNDLGSQGD